jgi:hypothetical protein
VGEGTGEHGLEDSGRGSRAAFWLAWSLAGLSVAMFLAQVALWGLARGRALARQPGGRPHAGQPPGSGCLPGLPAGGSPDRLQASPQSRGLDLPRRRPVLDDQRYARLLRSLRTCQSGLGTIPGRDGGDKRLVVGARGGAARNFPAPSLPGRQASLQEMAPAGLALGGCDRVAHPRRHALPPDPWIRSRECATPSGSRDSSG